MKKIRIGLVATVHRAIIAENWPKDGRAEIVAGCDIDPAHLTEFKEKYGQDKFVTEDYNELIARPDVDAVAIFTPDNVHAAPAIAAMKAGKDVFVEKPMAITIEDCQEMRKVEKETGRKMMVGFNMRYMDYFNTVKEVIDSGMIGQVKAVWVRHFVGFGGWAYFHDYRANRKGSTSLLLQKASHDIDMIHYLTGQHTKRVIGMGDLMVYGGDKPNDLKCDKCDEAKTCLNYSGRMPRKQFCLYRQEVDVEDHSMILMQLDGGIQANYMQCHFCPDTYRNYCIIGTNGRVESIEDEKVKVLTNKSFEYRRDQQHPYGEVTYDVGETKGGHGGADPKLCSAFLDYLLEDKAPRATSYDGLMAVAVGVKGAESLRNGNIPIDINLPR